MLIVEFVILKKKSHKFILFSLIIQEKSPPSKFLFQAHILLLISRELCRHSFAYLVC